MGRGLAAVARARFVVCVCVWWLESGPSFRGVDWKILSTKHGSACALVVRERERVCVLAGARALVDESQS